MTFEEFGLDPSVMEGLQSMGFKTPTPIQEKAIPVVLQNKDLIGCAQTGTGKTGAFLLPAIHNILRYREKHTEHFIHTLIIVPTRELAIQIDQQVEGFAYFTHVTSSAVYGGNDSNLWDKQKNAIVRGTEIVVATPGRLLAHLSLGYVDLSHLQCLILDEADRMLDMGFFEDIVRILKYVPIENRQTLLFSATMPSNIRQLAKKVLKDPVEISIAIARPPDAIIQAAYHVQQRDKLRLLVYVLKDKKHNISIIFSSTKTGVKDIQKALTGMGVDCRAIHSDLEQKEREAVMQDFRNRKFKTLIATDVVSRGIDIEGIDMILNFDVPRDPEDYVHRIGRTARAESSGIGLTLINERDSYEMEKIEKFLGKPIRRIPLPPEIGSAPVAGSAGSRPPGRPPFNRQRRR